jgi:3-hydroxyisobutyrate dehydrogenase-like beta-hydroxyacid dehydrogenase
VFEAIALCLEQGQAVGATGPFAALTRELLVAANGRGHGDDDFRALIEVLGGATGARL